MNASIYSLVTTRDVVANEEQDCDLLQGACNLSLILTGFNPIRCLNFHTTMSSPTPSTTEPVTSVDRIEKLRKDISSEWWVDPINADMVHLSVREEILVKEETPFQVLEIIKLGSFGQCLILDEKIQSSERDEYAYHESLVHPVLLSHETGPKRVFIGGGGEGATSREVLKHKSVEECKMVDIDGKCVEMCRKHLVDHHQGAFDNARHKLIIEDAKKILEESEDGHYDVIILDLADPVDGGPCYQLYTDSFYEMCKSKLAKGGILVTQSGPAGILSYSDVFTPIHVTVKKVFPKHTYAYMTNVPSFMDDYGFNMALKDDEPTNTPRNMSIDEVNKRIEERIEGGFSTLKYYDGETHQRMFNVIKPIRDAITKETRVITKDNYVFMPSESTEMKTCAL
jgi:thermospermine synthase